MIRINDMKGEGTAFKPVDPDTYQNGNMTMRFRRDAAGKVGGLDFSNPVFRSVKFTRMSDGTSGR